MGSRRSKLWWVVLAAGCSSPAAVQSGSSTTPDEPAASRPAASVASSHGPVAAVANDVPGSCERLSLPLPELTPVPNDPAVPDLVDYSGSEQMAGFYEKLAALLRGRATDHVRIGFYGDSNMTRDYITGELRRVLQKRLGDGGHGFIAVGKPWSWYIHTDTRHGAGEGWKVFNMSTDQVLDRMYGFGGIAAQSQYGKATAWIATAADGAPVGRRVSQIEVMYLKRPKSGPFQVKIDGKLVREVDALGSEPVAAIEKFEVPEGEHRLDLVAGGTPVRFLGAVFETRKPGVVVDSIGIGGVNVELMVRADEKLTVDTLKLREHDLFVLLTGATEPDMPKHVELTEQLISRHKQARPEAPFVVMSPPDLAGGTPDKPTKVVRITQIAKQKKRAAQAAKAMYWDFHGAMGGPLSMIQFALHKLAWKDMIHLNEAGGRALGRRFAYALIKDFNRYLKQHPQAGCGDGESK